MSEGWNKNNVTVHGISRRFLFLILILLLLLLLILIPDRALSMEVPELPTMITHAGWSIRIPAHSDSSRGGPPPVSLAEIDW